MTDPVTNNEDSEVLDAVGERDDGPTAETVDIDAGPTGGTSGSADPIANDEPASGGVFTDPSEGAAAPGGTPAQETALENDDDFEDTREEFDRLNDRHLRLVAEFNNFRRRSEQERLGAWSRAQADLVAKFLDVLDDLQRVAELDLSNATVEAIMEGVDLVERKFVRVIGEADVEVFDPTGEPFDPEFMEAMMRVPVQSDEPVDTVAQVFQKGYSLKGVLVRPARVSVYTQG